MREPEPYVGRPIERTEDPRLVQGQGQYVDALRLPDMRHLAFVRSPYPHARVPAIRTEAVRRAPGVLAVVTAKDLPPLRPTPFMAVLPVLKSWPDQALADGFVDTSRSRTPRSRSTAPWTRNQCARIMCA